METESEVSIDSGCANSLTNSCIQNSSESQLAVVSAEKGVYICQALSYGDEFRGGEEIDSYPANSLTHIQKSSENPREVVPTTKYITSSEKPILVFFPSAAALEPIPLLQEAIGVALKIIEVCEVREILGRVIIVHDLILLGHICRRSIGQEAAR